MSEIVWASRNCGTADGGRRNCRLVCGRACSSSDSIGGGRLRSLLRVRELGANDTGTMLEGRFSLRRPLAVSNLPTVGCYRGDLGNPLRFSHGLRRGGR